MLNIGNIHVCQMSASLTEGFSETGRSIHSVLSYYSKVSFLKKYDPAECSVGSYMFIVRILP